MSHRYATVTADHRAELRDAPAATPAADGVVVDITYCGICATDTHGWGTAGALPAPVFGHEWTGTVSAVGADAGSLRVGQRVVAAVGPACGRCAQCRAGHTEQCDLAFAEANGVSPGAGEHGGFATAVAVAARRVVAVPDTLTDEQAALVEPAAVTFHAVRRTAFELGSTVVVQGAGPIGLLTAMHARAAGAGHIIVVEPSQARRAVATALGFRDVVAPGFEEHLRDVTDGLGADVLFECTGAAALLQPSAELVRRGGTMALLGFPLTPSTVSYGDWQIRELTVIGSLAYTHADFAGAINAIANGAVDVTPLHTGTVGLDELQETLALLDSGESAHAKVLVDPRR
ncbi:zinc-binding dehydrogenase [Actinoplanes sp. NPDC051494]|uniref:zinc-binding dehydrogenase n=1 Tax=Actinoplanes sp. NPDC051494 TaxID=3363907 RepID=UPI0037A5EEAF